MRQVDTLQPRRSAVVVIALAVLLTLLIITGVSLRVQSDYETAVDRIEQTNANLARALEEHTIRTLNAADQTVQFLKFQYEKYGDKISISHFVTEGVIIPTLFAQIGIIDEQGNLVLSNIPNFKRVNLSDREHFQVHRDGRIAADQLYVSRPILGRASGKWSLQMTRRISKPDGSFGGVVVVSLDPFYFSNFYSTVDLGRDGEVTLLGQDFVVRARYAQSDAAAGLASDLSKSSLAQAIGTASSGNFLDSSPVDHVHRFFSFRRLKDYALTVVVGTSEQVSLHSFEKRRTDAYVYTALVCVVILGLAIWLARSLQAQHRTFEHLVEARLRAESANRLKSEFLASMSHELRTPLNGILGFSEVLLGQAQDPIAIECAQTVLSNGQHLLELLNSILDLAKIEAGQMNLNVRPIDIRKILIDISRLHEKTAQAKGLSLICDFAENLPHEFAGDRTKITQVLNNLLHNAIKFTDRGEVRLNVALGHTQGQAELQIAVIDTGPGIPVADQEQIFERFRQVATFETRRHGGTGLGLALCRELLSLMHGSIKLSSQPGQGARFDVVIPAAS